MGTVAPTFPPLSQNFQTDVLTILGGYSFDLFFNLTINFQPLNTIFDQLLTPECQFVQNEPQTVKSYKNARVDWICADRKMEGQI